MMSCLQIKIENYYYYCSLHKNHSRLLLIMATLNDVLNNGDIDEDIHYCSDQIKDLKNSVTLLYKTKKNKSIAMHMCQQHLEKYGRIDTETTIKIMYDDKYCKHKELVPVYNEHNNERYSKYIAWYDKTNGDLVRIETEKGITEVFSMVGIPLYENFERYVEQNTNSEEKYFKVVFNFNTELEKSWRKISDNNFTKWAKESKNVYIRAFFKKGSYINSYTLLSFDVLDMQ